MEVQQIIKVGHRPVVSIATTNFPLFLGREEGQGVIHFSILSLAEPHTSFHHDIDLISITIPKPPITQ